MAAKVNVGFSPESSHQLSHKIVPSGYCLTGISIVSCVHNILGEIGPIRNIPRDLMVIPARHWRPVCNVILSLNIVHLHPVLITYLPQDVPSCCSVSGDGVLLRGSCSCTIFSTLVLACLLLLLSCHLLIGTVLPPLHRLSSVNGLHQDSWQARNFNTWLLGGR